jgi:hypothetical protein
MCASGFVFLRAGESAETFSSTTDERLGRAGGVGERRCFSGISGLCENGRQQRLKTPHASQRATSLAEGNLFLKRNWK